MAKRVRRLQFREQWSEAISYVWDTQIYIYFGILIFILSVYVGFFFASRLSFLNKLIATLISEIVGLNWYQLIFFILQNNLHSSFLSLFLGFFFGIFSFISILLDGILLGYVLHQLYLVSGFSEFWRIFPHGIFELPAIFISVGMGIKFGMSFFSLNPWRTAKERFYQSINVFLLIVVPLLIIAAIIEGSLIALLR